MVKKELEGIKRLVSQMSKTQLQAIVVGFLVERASNTEIYREIETGLKKMIEENISLLGKISEVQNGKLDDN